MNPTESRKTERVESRNAGCAQAAAYSGCRTWWMVVSATDETAVIRLIQQRPSAARSRICGGSFVASGFGVSNASDDSRWILIRDLFLLDEALWHGRAHTASGTGPASTDGDYHHDL